MARHDLEELIFRDQYGHHHPAAVRFWAKKPASRVGKSHTTEGIPMPTTFEAAIRRYDAKADAAHGHVELDRIAKMFAEQEGLSYEEALVEVSRLTAKAQQTAKEQRFMGGRSTPNPTAPRKGMTGAPNYNELDELAKERATATGEPYPAALAAVSKSWEIHRKTGLHHDSIRAAVQREMNQR